MEAEIMGQFHCRTVLHTDKYKTFLQFEGTAQLVDLDRIHNFALNFATRHNDVFARFCSSAEFYLNGDACPLITSTRGIRYLSTY